jgi:hypothetical protein
MFHLAAPAASEQLILIAPPSLPPFSTPKVKPEILRRFVLGGLFIIIIVDARLVMRVLPTPAPMSFMPLLIVRIEFHVADPDLTLIVSPTPALLTHLETEA